MNDLLEALADEIFPALDRRGHDPTVDVVEWPRECPSVLNIVNLETNVGRGATCDQLLRL